MVGVCALFSRYPWTWENDQIFSWFLHLDNFYRTDYSVCSMILKEILSFPNMFSNPNQIASLNVNVSMLWSLSRLTIPNWEHKEHFYQLWMLTLIHYPSGPLTCILSHPLYFSPVRPHSLYLRLLRSKSSKDPTYKKNPANVISPPLPIISLIRASKCYKQFLIKITLQFFFAHLNRNLLSV